MQLLQVLQQYNTAASSATRSSSSQCDFYSLPGGDHQYYYLIIVLYTRFLSGKWLGEWRKNESKNVQRGTNTNTPELVE